MESGRLTASRHLAWSGRWFSTRIKPLIRGRKSYPVTERIDRMFRKSRGVCAVAFQPEFNGVKPIGWVRLRYNAIYIATITIVNAMIKQASRSILYTYKTAFYFLFFLLLHIRGECYMRENCDNYELSGTSRLLDFTTTSCSKYAVLLKGMIGFSILMIRNVHWIV